MSSAGPKALNPVSGDVGESCDVECVVALPACLRDGDEARFGEESEVSRGRRPGAVESVSEFAGGHGAASGSKHDQNVSTGGVSERIEDGVEAIKIVEAFGRGVTR